MDARLLAIRSLEGDLVRAPRQTPARDVDVGRAARARCGRRPRRSAALPTAPPPPQRRRRLWRSPILCAWYWSTAAVVARMVARSMMEGMSSCRLRRAMASMLVIGVERQGAILEH